MLVKDIQGLKFPDTFVTRFFYKEKLNTKLGRVLELGCGNGNNLSLFYQYGWDVDGVDLSNSSIEAANTNHSKIKQQHSLPNNFRFVADDMLHYLQHTKETSYDALVLASSIYYLEHDKIEQLLQLLTEKNILAPGADVYVRMRKDNDYRYGKGTAIGPKSFKISITETGEQGCNMTFYSEDEFIALFTKYIPLKDKKTMSVFFDNYQNDTKVQNHDLVMWGKFQPA